MIETIPPEMKEDFLKAKKIIESSEDIKIYSHTDCDGISSGAILSTILDRIG
jgi:RecJ-like exonuclease